MFATLALVVAASLVGPLLAAGRRPIVPVVVGEIGAGLILGKSGFGWIDPTVVPLPSLSSIGFILLMFAAGARIQFDSPAFAAGARRAVVALALVAGASIPAALLLARVSGEGSPGWIAVLLAGSSAAIVLPVLAEQGIDPALTAALVAWVAIADTATVVLLPLAIGQTGSPLTALVSDAAIVAAAAVILVAGIRLRTWGPMHVLWDRSRKRGWALQMRAALVLVFIFGAVAETWGGSQLVAGFVAGLVLGRLREPSRLATQLGGVADGFFVPVFFVLLGARLDLHALLGDPAALVFLALDAALVVAVHLFGSLAMPRGRVSAGLAASVQLGLPSAAATLGLQSGVISPALAAALVGAALLTLIPGSIGSFRLAGDLADRRPDAVATPRGAS
ncbi:MAG TPA: cation:proton antiporter [Candidatus Limnocylindrales bacterium]|nr:cation:proton antiporter [Candidatus Limnocylindrales bacterium]